MISELFGGDKTVSTGTKVILAMAAATVALALVAGVGAADTEEMANETVTFSNESDLNVSVEWNESIADPSTTSADVTVYHASEFESDPSTATAIVEDSISAEQNATTTATYGESDGLEDGTDYQVVVSADDTLADSVDVDDGSGWFGGGVIGGSGGGSMLLLLALAVGGAWYVKED